MLLLLQAALGLEINARDVALRVTHPRLPAGLAELRIRNLQIAGARLDVLLLRQADEVSVHQLQSDGEVRLVVVT